MTAQAITMTGVAKDNNTGVITWQFGPEGIEKTIEQSLSVRDELQHIETAKKLLIAKAIANSPDGTNLETMVGVVCTIDFDANDPISFSE